MWWLLVLVGCFGWVRFVICVVLVCRKVNISSFEHIMLLEERGGEEFRGVCWLISFLKGITRFFFLSISRNKCIVFL